MESLYGKGKKESFLSVESENMGCILSTQRFLMTKYNTGTTLFGQTALRSRKSTTNASANTHHRNSVLIQKL